MVGFYNHEPLNGMRPSNLRRCPVVISLLIGQTHASEGTLDLFMTDVPTLVQVIVVAPLGNLDD